MIAAARKIDGLGGLAEAYGVRAVSADLATAEGAQHLFDEVAKVGPVDVLVNNVGAGSPRLAGVAAVTDEQWLATLTINLLSTVRVTRAALPGLLETQGTIVNVYVARDVDFSAVMR